MPEIVLTEEQARGWREAGKLVTVRGPDGRPMAAFDAVEAELFAKILERREQRRTDPRPDIPAEVVHAGLVALEAEWDRLGGFDAAYARQFVDRFRAARNQC